MWLTNWQRTVHVCMYAGEVEGGAVHEDARQATGACLGTWRGGGKGKNTRQVLKVAREQWEIKNKKNSHFGTKKQLEPLWATQNSSMSYIEHEPNIWLSSSSVSAQLISSSALSWASGNTRCWVRESFSVREKLSHTHILCGCDNFPISQSWT